MACRSLSSIAAVALALSLAACAGGSSGGGSVTPGPGPNNPGSVTITPSALAFTGPGSPTQTFTLNSSVTGRHHADDRPAVLRERGLDLDELDHPAAGLYRDPDRQRQLLVRDPLRLAVGRHRDHGRRRANPAIAGGGAVSLFVGGTSGSLSINASSGTLTPDSNACAGIASITTNPGGTAASQTYTVAPLAVGSCTLTVVDGASFVSVPISVSSTSNSAGVFVNPTAMTIASPRIDPFSCPNPGSTCAYGPSQSGTISFSGSVGQVSIDEHECLGAPPVGGPNTMAFMSIPGSPPNPVSLPTSFTVNSYGNKLGVCHIFINPQFGSGATLTVTIN